MFDPRRDPFVDLSATDVHCTYRSIGTQHRRNSAPSETGRNETRLAQTPTAHHLAIMRDGVDICTLLGPSCGAHLRHTCALPRKSPHPPHRT
jgi:hypothetical protein